MGIFDWLFGGKKTTPPLKKETIVKKTAETTKKPVVNKPAKNIFNNISLKTAVEEWQENRSKAEKKYGHISNWNVSNITNMYGLFSNDESFNEDISNWDVSNVENMSHLFFCTDSFNQDIGNWNVSKVKNMWRTFYSADVFNQDIGKWDVSNVTNMEEMFFRAKNFNQDIGNWNVSNVENMNLIFSKSDSFKQDLSGWNLNKIKQKIIKETIEHLNNYSTTKITIDSKTKSRLKNRTKKVIELNIDDIKIKTTIGKFETAMDGENSYVVSDYDDDYNLYFKSSAEEVCIFLNDITDEKLVITAEYYANDNQLGEIRLEQVIYLNCECPEKLKKYYDGELFIHYKNELLEIKSDDYKKIDFDKIWDEAEITNSGVICERFDD